MGRKKHTLEFVEQYFEDGGCILLEEEYIGALHKMRYICSCGNISKISFGNFQQGYRCNKCGSVKSSEKRKHSFKYVKQYFKDHGCKLLETEYINNHTLMKYICNCGDIREISFKSFKRGERCQKCGGNEKYTLEYVEQCFSDNGCVLLEKEYLNNKTPMKYICCCGDISNINFKSFKKGVRCRKCAGVEKYTLEFIERYFEKHGCKLLETKYKNNRTLMRYRCSCGNKSKISFCHFKEGKRCKECANKGYSKESQKLFDAIYIKLNNNYKNKTYYATLNHEFGINYNGKGFKYDYVNSKSKKVIEYNGRVWYPTPNLKDRDIGWHAIDKTKTAKEARDYEKIKYEGLKKTRISNLNYMGP